MAEPARFDYARLAHPPVTFGHEKLKIGRAHSGGAPLHRRARLNEHHAGTRSRRRPDRPGRPLQHADPRAAAARPRRRVRRERAAAARAQRHLPDRARRDRRLRRRQARGARRRGRPAGVHRARHPRGAASRRRDDGAARQGPAADGRRVHRRGDDRRARSLLEQHLPDVDTSACARLARRQRARRGEVAAQLGRAVPARPPGFCIGCPERPVFAALKLAQQDVGPVHVAADIGCHALATFEPFSSGHSILGYGMSLASSAGVAPMMQRRVAVDHGRRRLLAQRPAHRRAVLALQRRRLGAADHEERLHLGDRHAGHHLDARRGREGARARPAAKPGRPQHDDRVDAEGPRRAVDAHRPHLPRRRDEGDAARGVHDRLRRA